MGYTHYFGFKKEIGTFNEKFLEDVKKVLGQRNRTIQFEMNIKKPYLASETIIRFNGIEEQGHETFMLSANEKGFGFCKTARKDYDYYVVLVLALAKWHYRDFFDLSSDGFGVTEDEFFSNKFDGEWTKAIKKIKKEFGYDFCINKEISKSDKYYYYSLQLDTKEEKIDIKMFGQWLEDMQEERLKKNKMLNLLAKETEKVELYDEDEIEEITEIIKKYKKRRVCSKEQQSL